MISKWKNKWFYYKLLTALIILGGLLAVYLYHMIAQVWIRNVQYPFSYVLFQGQFFSYFTYQSNMIVGLWFLLATIFHQKNNRIVESQNVRLAITAYISVTCLTYILVLVPAFFSAGKLPGLRGAITGVFFHIVSPFLMIFYSLKHLDPHKWNTISFKKGLLNYLIYPWFYICYILMRIALFFFDTSLSDVPFRIVYPYAPILGNISTAGVLKSKISFFLLVIAFFIIVQVFFILFYFLYFYVIKKNNLKKFNQEHNKLKAKKVLI